MFCIEGMGKDYKSPNFLAETNYDHRIAMSFAIAGLNSDSLLKSPHLSALIRLFQSS